MNFNEEELVRKTESDDEVKSLREEIKEKRRELEWKVEELADKRKEIQSQQVLINTLKNKKEKQGTLDINQGLIKKNAALKEDKKKLLEDIKTIKTKAKEMNTAASKDTAGTKALEEKKEKYRQERNKALEDLAKSNKDNDRLRDERKKAQDDFTNLKVEHAEHVERLNDVNQKEAKDGLRKTIANLEERLNILTLEDAKESTQQALSPEDAPKSPSAATSADDSTDNESKDDKDDKVAASPELRPMDNLTDDEAAAPPKERRQDVKKRGSRRKLLPSQEEDQDNSASKALAADDSFDTIPTSTRRRGKKNVTNSTLTKPKSSQPSSKALRYSNRNYAVTILNEQVSFIVVAEKYRSKHDVVKYGIRPCGLYPTCSNLFRGGEDIAKVIVISPDHHKSYEEETWACFYHAEASIQGQEVQTQGSTTTDDDETPAKKTTEDEGEINPPAPVKAKLKPKSGGSKEIENEK